MKRIAMAVGMAGWLGCGASGFNVVTGPTEQEGVESAQQLLGLRLAETFGEAARVDRVFSKDGSLLVGVTLERPAEDGDVVPPMAIVSYDEAADSLNVLAKEAAFTEARLAGETAVLVSADGQLLVGETATQAQVVASNVKGDVSISPDGQTVALSVMPAPSETADSSVAVTDLSGNLKVIVEADGVNNRPTIAPDGQTLVYVSGKTGIASLWRTSVAGETPVQVTNVGLELGEGEPVGFVPPPVGLDRLAWVSGETLRYDAGGGEYWTVNVFTGEAAREGGAQ